MRTARVFNNGNSQAVRLPKEFRLNASEVFIRKDSATGDIVLSARPPARSWSQFFELRARTRVPGNFMVERPLNEKTPVHDPFAAPVRRKRARK